MLRRVENWPTRFHAFLLERDLMQFAWGTNDCAMFSVDGIEVLTGVDVAREYRGRYRTAAGARKAIRRVTMFGNTVEDAAQFAALEHGLPEIPVRNAGRGDWTLIANAGDRILGLVHLNGRDIVSVGENGIVFVPLSSALRAWRV